MKTQSQLNRVNRKTHNRSYSLHKLLLFSCLLLSISWHSPKNSYPGIRLCLADGNRDFYKILGIPRSAKEREIKKAFKKMSIKYHPDKNKGDEDAMRKYQDITAAYDALSDPERRRKYD